MVGHVEPRHLERGGREIDGIDHGIAEAHRRDDRKASGARAQLQHATHRLRALGQEILALEHLRQHHLAEIGARHDDPLVDAERDAADIGAPQQIGGGLARGDACIDEADQALPLRRGEARIEEGLELVHGKMQPFQHHERRLVERGRRAVAEEQPGLVEPADRPAKDVAHRDEFGGKA